MTDVVESTVSISSVRPGPDGFRLLGRVVSVVPKVQAERALVGLEVQVLYQKPQAPSRLAFHPGLLFRVGIPLAVANQALDALAADQLVPSIEFQSDDVRPMTEPCPRVPLSLLRELRGQEAIAERSRRALVRVWQQQRPRESSDG